MFVDSFLTTNDTMLYPPPTAEQWERLLAAVDGRTPGDLKEFAGSVLTRACSRISLKCLAKTFNVPTMGDETLGQNNNTTTDVRQNAPRPLNHPLAGSEVLCQQPTRPNFGLRADSEFSAPLAPSRVSETESQSECKISIIWEEDVEGLYTIEDAQTACQGVCQPRVPKAPGAPWFT